MKTLQEREFDFLNNNLHLANEILEYLEDNHLVFHQKQRDIQQLFNVRLIDVFGNDVIFNKNNSELKVNIEHECLTFSSKIMFSSRNDHRPNPVQDSNLIMIKMNGACEFDPKFINKDSNKYDVIISIPEINEYLELNLPENYWDWTEEDYLMLKFVK